MISILVGSAMVGYTVPELPKCASWGRREALSLGTAATTAVFAGEMPAMAEEPSVPIKAQWSATDGFSNKDFIAFDEGAYAAMRDDERRTPLFEKAIQQRLAAAPPNTLTVVEIGTGPYALLAIAAARAGARKVYSVEANPEAAKRARAALKQAGMGPEKVEVLEGFSTQVSLPEKVDLLVAEIAGSIASEEGACATIRDAQARFLKKPAEPDSYIPYACQTLAAPASYALHYALGPPAFDWTKLKEPVRLNCRDESVQLLAQPQLLEQITFSDTHLPASGRVQGAPLTWRVDAARVEANQAVFYDELRREGAKEGEASSLSRSVARSVSGLVMWPRLLLDPQGTLVVESRGPNGEHQKSHWQTVLPLMAARPVAVAAAPPSTIRVALSVDYGGGEVNTPLKYSLEGSVSS